MSLTYTQHIAFKIGTYATLSKKVIKTILFSYFCTCYENSAVAVPAIFVLDFAVGTNGEQFRYILGKADQNCMIVSFNIGNT